MEQTVDTFVEAVCRQDSRNRFSRSQKKETCSMIAPLYNKWEPEDVEAVFTDLTAMRFYPSEKFSELHREYGFQNPHVTVFASWEGDPVYVLDEKIYIAAHGRGQYEPDKSFPTLDIFLSWVIQNLRK